MWGSKIIIITLLISLMYIAAIIFGLWSRTPLNESTINFFSKDFLLQAAEYEQKTLTVFILRNTLVWLLLFLITAATWNYFAKLKPPPLYLVPLCLVLILLAVCILTFPLDYYKGFTLEHLFDLSNQTRNSWLLDYLKSSAVEIFIYTVLFTGLFALIQYFPTRWWWIGGGSALLLLLFFAYMHPLIIEPMFYNYNTIKDETLNSRIIEMGDQAGIEIDEVLIADASRRTQKVNASFSGVGDTRRIVVYDNLVEKFSTDKALAVIAHEIGHWKHSHLLKSIFIGTAQAFLALFLFSRIIKELGISQDLRIITVALIFFTLFSFAVLPAQNAFSRAFERQADKEALLLVDDPEIHISLHQELACANLSQVKPHFFTKLLLYSHPPATERIRDAAQK